MNHQVSHSRRHFIGTAALAVAVAPFAPAGAQAGGDRAAQPVPGSTQALSHFGPLKQIDAGVLSVGYAEVGPADGRPVLLLHGWPYDIHTFVDVAPLLAAAGYWV